MQVQKHSLAIGQDGYLYAWGDNPIGQLGDGTTTLQNTPTKIGSRKYFHVSAGAKHSLAIGQDGYLYAWGDNSNGHWELKI